jgi:hypothetical protein
MYTSEPPVSYLLTLDYSATIFEEAGYSWAWRGLRLILRTFDSKIVLSVAVLEQLVLSVHADRLLETSVLESAFDSKFSS